MDEDVHKARLKEYQKWDYITLSDFHTTSFTTFLSYGWLWFLALVSVAVYGSDTFTAVNLLATNKWSGTFTPYIPLNISKWIFTGCILFSWVLLLHDSIRAYRVIRRGNVADSYLDPLAVRVQSMRVNSGGQGFRRFLVFETLTKSKKGADYIALFAYFQFKSSIRLVLAESPRQVINALTIYSLLRADLLPIGDHRAEEGNSSFTQFWINVKILYQASPEQAVVIFTMLFTLFIWVFSALCFITAVVLYWGFLWHYIPKEYGGLNNYCRAKVDKRLGRVVNEKAKRAIEREEKKRGQDEEMYGESKPPALSRAPTLPTLGEVTPKTASMWSPTPKEHLSEKSSVVVSVRQPKLPCLEEEETSMEARSPTLPELDEFCDPHEQELRRPTLLTRQSSGLSVSSFNSDRPLLENAAKMSTVISPIARTAYISDSTSRSSSPASSRSIAMQPIRPGPYTPKPLERRPVPARSATSTSTGSVIQSNLRKPVSAWESENNVNRVQMSRFNSNFHTNGTRNESVQSDFEPSTGAPPINNAEWRRPMEAAPRPKQENYVAYKPYGHESRATLRSGPQPISNYGIVHSMAASTCDHAGGRDARGKAPPARTQTAPTRSEPYNLGNDGLPY